MLRRWSWRERREKESVPGIKRETERERERKAQKRFAHREVEGEKLDFFSSSQFVFRMQKNLHPSTLFLYFLFYFFIIFLFVKVILLS